ncbi:MAG TPA: sodium:calcium antiporter [Actinomycetota bacterium]
MDWVLLLVSLVVILFGAKLFTNGVEWIGEGFGLSAGAVGSVLAAIGTALPETVLPVIAIVGGGGAHSGEEIGIGAILGAPFMLATLAMTVMGLSLAWYARSGRRVRSLAIDPGLTAMDLAFFLVMYGAAVLAGVIHVRPAHWALSAALLAGYGVYVWRHFRSEGEAEEEREAAGEIHPLSFTKWAARVRRSPRRADVAPPTWASVVQTLVALAIIVGGARVFVDGIHHVATSLGVSPLLFSLVVAPIATELPELFNSVLWVGRDKDVLALGNVTGAMVFQSSFPVTIGLLFTPWQLTGDAVLSAAIALFVGLVLLIVVRIRGTLTVPVLVAPCVLYAAFVAVVIATG